MSVGVKVKGDTSVFEGLRHNERFSDWTIEFVSDLEEGQHASGAVHETAATTAAASVHRVHTAIVGPHCDFFAAQFTTSSGFSESVKRHTSVVLPHPCVSVAPLFLDLVYDFNDGVAVLPDQLLRLACISSQLQAVSILNNLLELMRHADVVWVEQLLRDIVSPLLSVPVDILDVVVERAAALFDDIPSDLFGGLFAETYAGGAVPVDSAKVSRTCITVFELAAAATGHDVIAIDVSVTVEKWLLNHQEAILSADCGADALSLITHPRPKHAVDLLSIAFRTRDKELADKFTAVVSENFDLLHLDTIESMKSFSLDTIKGILLGDCLLVGEADQVFRFVMAYRVHASDLVKFESLFLDTVDVHLVEATLLFRYIDSFSDTTVRHILRRRLEYEADRRKVAPLRVYCKEELCQRLVHSSGSWMFSNQTEGIEFSVDRDIKLTGFDVYVGKPGDEYEGEIWLKNSDTILYCRKDTFVFDSTRDKPSLAYYRFAKPIALESGRWYCLALSVKGPKTSSYGVKGKSVVLVGGGRRPVTFKFREAAMIGSRNGTSVRSGQLPTLHYRAV
eukprot:TRINITY_DN6116_c0_g1_i1.p1 TRINITY_DN6116_c0_g1~~TRINITY_DN6116_c0_g1_i1.p1  ORF type:complete len:564 (+),score=114.09 TRINITY_DN6116_c0_g1_i1:154-1845(+)